MIQLITGDYHMSFTRYHALTIAIVASMQQIAFAETSTYNIAAAPLSQTMAQIARQNGVTISADPELLKGKSAPAIRGNHSVETAFNLALISSGLQLIKNADGTVYSLRVTPVEEKPQARDLGRLRTIDVDAANAANPDLNAVQLPVIVVDAEKNGSAEDGYFVKNITGAGVWRERSLQDTPYSMTVISQELIENVQANDMNQIFKMNPTTQEVGYAFNGNGDTTFPTMRGFAVRNPIINGISYAHSRSTTPMMQDIERIEIISGTTGFLYGGGRVGGAINYITKKPTIKDLKNITIGSYGNESYYGHIDLSGQFNEDNTLGYRINTLYQNGELISNEKKEQKNMSLVFDWKPTDNFYTDIKYSSKDSFTKGANTYFNSGVQGFDRESIKSNKNYNPHWIENEIKSDKFESGIKYDINDIFTLRTNTFYEDMDYSTDYSYLFVKNGYVIKGADSYFTKNSMQRIKNYGSNIYFDSKFNTGSIKHILTVGYSFSSNIYSQPSDRSSRLAYYDLSQDVILNDLENLTEPNWGSKIGTQPPTKNSKLQFKNILIGNDIVFNEHLNVLIGANYATSINKSYISNTKYDKSELTPTLSIMFKPFKNLTSYATYIESLEQGTIVGSTYINANEVLPPLVSTQYEVGAKYNLKESLLLTGALFRIEKANQYSDLASPKPRYVQDGRQVHQGLELTMAGKITDNLNIFGGGTLMDIEVSKSNTRALEGKKPTNAATKMAKMYTEYNIPIIQGLTITGGVYYTGSKYGNTTNTDKMPSYTLFDASLRYQTMLGHYPTTFTLISQNITDKVYWNNGEQLGSPRTIAFSVKTQF